MGTHALDVPDGHNARVYPNRRDRLTRIPPPAVAPMPPLVPASPPFVATRLPQRTRAAIVGCMHPNENSALGFLSLLSVLLLSFHLSDDIVRGFEPGGVGNVMGIVTLVAWLSGTLLLLAERRSGYVIVFVGSLLGFGVPIIHMTRAGLVGGRIAHSSGMFFWVWTLIALGVSAGQSVVLSARALWQRRSSRRPAATPHELVS